MTLAQVATDEKSNEITAIPELLTSHPRNCVRVRTPVKPWNPELMRKIKKLVDLSGAIVTIDAMGTQKKIAKQIVDGDGDFVLALKGNQGTLHDGVIAYFDQQVESDFAGVKVRRHTTSEKGHGRQETRIAVQCPVPKNLPGLEGWTGIATIGMVALICQRNGRETTETRYFISSLPLGVKRFAKAVRSHWSIENSCHWSLDFTYREDESRMRQTALRENFAWLRRFTLSLLKQHPGKTSISMKRQKCGWSEEMILQVLTRSTT